MVYSSNANDVLSFQSGLHIVMYMIGFVLSYIFEQDKEFYKQRLSIIIGVLAGPNI